MSCLRFLWPAALLSLIVSMAALADTPAAPLQIPGSTAYIEPNPEGAHVSQRQGILDWKDASQRVVWFGELKATGTLKVSVDLKLRSGSSARLKLSVDKQARESEVKASADDSLVSADFGGFSISSGGYHRFTLEMAEDAKGAIERVATLVLDGPAMADAHFNTNPRRNAASVHLAYPTPKTWNIDAFYCEVTATEDPMATYYMACGWHRGYFGMQVNSATERRIIFSVWDSGNEAKDRGKVASENRVQLLAKGDGVTSSDFGNEGTGGHSHLVFPWKTGDAQRFLVTAKPVGTNQTVYTGYYFHPDHRQWMTIASFKAPKDGGYMRGLYSFSENFGGANGQLRRKALYGNQWVRTSDGQWHEQTDATFSHDPTGKSDRLDRFMGVENGQFFLSQGGFVPGTTPFGEKFSRPSAGRQPDIPAGLLP